MKKVLSVLLMVLFIIALVACNGEIPEAQVPVYEGMTVSSAAEIASNDTMNVSLISYKTALTKQDEKPGGCDYYADRGEDIYIHIHIKNPQNFEILSFTLTQ